MKSNYFLVAAISIISVLVIIGSVSAWDIPMTQDIAKNIQAPCSINGTACSNAATCSISITNPDGTYLLNNQAMDNEANGYFNYTVGAISSPNTYPGTVFCLDGGYGGVGNFNLVVTQTGFSMNDEWNRLMFFFIVSLVLYFVFLLISWRTELAWVGFIAGVVLLIPGIYMMINWTTFADNLMTLSLALVLVAVAIATIIIFSVEGIRSGNEEFVGGKDEETYDYFKEHD